MRDLVTPIYEGAPLTCTAGGECAVGGGSNFSALLVFLGCLAVWQSFKMVRNARKRKA